MFNWSQNGEDLPSRDGMQGLWKFFSDSAMLIDLVYATLDKEFNIEILRTGGELCAIFDTIALYS